VGNARAAGRARARARLRHRARRGRDGAHRRARDRLDAEPALLARASEKLPDAEWIAGDMSAFALARRDFDLVVIAFNTLNVLVDASDALACVTCARDHLAPAGRLAIDIAVPTPERLVASVDERITSYALPDGTSVRITGSRSYDPALQRRRIALTIHRSDRSEPEHDELVTRVTFPNELVLLVEQAGLRIESVWGDYARTPFGAAAKQCIVVGEPRGASDFRTDTSTNDVS
jgi:hypothetical protein